jgi:hypothetical protein
MSSTMKLSNIKRLIFLIKALRYRHAKYFGFNLWKNPFLDARHPATDPSTFDIQNSTFDILNFPDIDHNTAEIPSEVIATRFIVPSLL